MKPNINEGIPNVVSNAEIEIAREVSTSLPDTFRIRAVEFELCGNLYNNLKEKRTQTNLMLIPPT